MLLAIRRYKWRLGFFVVTLMLSGCYSSGNNFNSSGQAWLQAGASTVNDAKIFLQADPINVYRQADGSSLQVWQHTASLFPDGVYRYKELWLEFDNSDVLRRIVKRN